MRRWHKGQIVKQTRQRTLGYLRLLDRAKNALGTNAFFQLTKMPILILLLFLVLLWPSDSFLPTKPIRNAVMRRYVGLERGLYLETMIAKKRVEVSNLLRRHSDPSDDLMMRMTYVATKNNGNMTKALRRPAGGEHQHSGSPPAWTQTQTQTQNLGSGSQANAGLHTMSLVIDMKRRSPTNPDVRRVMEFDSAGHYAKLLAQVSVDALLINTEEMEYGGKPTGKHVMPVTACVGLLSQNGC